MRRMVVAAVAAATLLGACSAERTAPQPTRPAPTTTGSVDRADAGVAGTPPPASDTTPSSVPPPATATSTTTTTLPPPTPAAWAAFDAELERRLIGNGNFSASVAVARHGELLHQAAYGVRVPALPTTTTSTTAPPGPTTSTTPTTTAVPTTTTTTTTTAPATTISARSTTTSPAGRSLGASSRQGGADATGAPTSSAPGATSTSSTASTSTTSTSTTTTTLAPGTEPAATSHRFRIASISKVIAAAVVLVLVEDRELTLDEPVGERLAAAVGAQISDPQIPSVTVRQLLSHTAGFDPYQRTFFGGGADSCRSAAVRGLSRGLNNPPGAVYDYSNMNYCLLGLLVEDVTGQPFQAAAYERLLRPLGIDGMRMVGTFDDDPGEVEHPSIPGRVYMEALGAAGAWVATAADVVRIVDALEPSRPGWHPLSIDTLSLMRVPAPTANPPAVREQWYGLGQIVYADGSWGHTGTVENTHAMVLARPDGVTWSILVSGEYPENSSRLRQIFDETVAGAGIQL